MSELGCAHITPVGGNVFADLGFAPDEALRLKSASDTMIRQKLALKSRFLVEIGSWISRSLSTYLPPDRRVLCSFLAL